MEKVISKFKSSDEKTDINVITWIPDKEPAGVLQIAHGMVEYIDRYHDFACFLAEKGFVVTGNDHLGHGDSVTSKDKWGFFSEKDGNEKVLKDMNELMNLTKSKWKDKPYFLLGHSMGSFLTRQFLFTYPEQKLRGTIIMGTGYQSKGLINLGYTLSTIEGSLRGWKNPSRLVNRIALGSNNKKFKPARTKNDWLSKDNSLVDKYNKEPRNRFLFTNRAYRDMFKGILTLYIKSNLEMMDKNMPIFIVSGSMDPVGDFGEAVKKLYQEYLNIGIIDVNFKLYENDRHEILNELDRDMVYEDILCWLKKYL